MKKFFCIAVSLAVASTLFFTGCSANKGGIGVIQLVEHPALDSSYEGFKKALEDNKDKLEAKKVKIDIDFQNAQNDQSNLKTISQKFVTDKKDLVLAIATPSAQSIAAETKDIPILITAVTDPYESGLVDSNEMPGRNVSGTSDLTPVADQLALLAELIPTAKKVAVVYSSGEQNSVIQANMAEEAAKGLGMTIERKTVTSTNDVAQVLESIVADKFDAVYIPTDNTLASAMPLVSSITTPAKIPVIVGEQGMLEGGALASVGINYYNLGYLTGEMAVEVLADGKNPKDMPIQYVANPDILINEDTVKALGISIPEYVVKDAIMVKTASASNQ